MSRSGLSSASCLKIGSPHCSSLGSARHDNDVPAAPVCVADKAGMNKSRRSFVSCVAVITLVAVAFGSTGCTSMRPIALATSPTDAPFGKVKVGDSVSVQMKDGRRERFVVRGVEGDELVSDR